MKLASFFYQDKERIGLAVGVSDIIDLSLALGPGVMVPNTMNKVAEIVSYISQFHTLSPGDVISCGTAFKPSVGHKSIHHANFLKVGGPVQITIENLGTQENPVVIEEREIGKWRLS